MTLIPVFDDVEQTKKENLEAELKNHKESEQSKIEELEQELQRVKMKEQEKIERLQEELRRIKDREARKIEKLESDMQKMQENLEMFRLLATRRMEELERLVQEDVNNIEEEVWRNLDVTRKANIDLAATIADEKQATDERLRALDDNQRKRSTMEKQLHSSVARCEFELSNLTAKVQTMEQSWFLQNKCGGERDNGEQRTEQDIDDGGSKPHLGGEVHQLKDAIISVLKGVDTSYMPKKGSDVGSAVSDNNPIRLTINMKMNSKADTQLG